MDDLERFDRLVYERDALRAENAHLKAQVEQLKADGERLDWLAVKSVDGVSIAVMVEHGHENIFAIISDLCTYEGQGPSIREAIDLARKAKGEE